jgi:hypothetical protein
MLPDFLIIGAPRSATTFFMSCASEHPNIYMASLRDYGSGDIHFFDANTKISYEHNFEKGIEWYQQLFEKATTETVIGEKTAHYLCDPQAPDLIRRHIPKVQMIAILRNPVERAYSDYWYHIGEIPPGMSFLEACYSERTKRLLLLEAGFYYRHVRRYLEFFDRSQCLFLLYDDLKENPLQSLQRAFRFLKVDPDFVPSMYHQKMNVALMRKRGRYYCLRLFGGLIKQNCPTFFNLAKRLPIAHVIQARIAEERNVDSYERGYPSMSVEARTKLSAVYYEQNQKLANFLNRDLIQLWHT